MSRQRQHFSASEKSKIALLAIRSEPNKAVLKQHGWQ